MKVRAVLKQITFLFLLSLGLSISCSKQQDQDESNNDETKSQTEGISAPASPVKTATVVVTDKSKISSLEESVKLGKTMFDHSCTNCHQANGKGITGVFPPLAKSDFLMADKDRSIDIVLHGLSGKIKVRGKEFNGVMLPQTQFSDVELAGVLNYVRNSWGNKGEQIFPESVNSQRKKP
jgi:nitrite reductase (NO-forming)